ncbi:hypothetical protein ASF66_00815 [Pseudomonas sp. Leaf129]|uniref:phage protein NinX family protein n=1 Tax=Pseudomonas sp. Leaf129 TaxID=1736268 RepID=UPI0007036AAA|nr:phage protein NinX family protein [Pseudomonas sp. Leaf129]KQQ62927.1 hypothetical protein ASF66_00815 [Pseudomonas sp. Leaf129]
MTDLLEVQTSTLAGAALDWAVAKATGADDLRITAAGSICCIYELPCGSGCWTEYYQPSTDWAVDGLLIRSHRMGFGIYPDGFFACVGLDDLGGSASGPSHLIAACRAIVAAKLGDTVQVPKELIQ